ncbi:DUF2852 domain-containing protein [Stappia sp.]|jgi:hypothetical protein|uniref:DUF2852 domain-containing protein n=1 Tax=Stappia sp. TaxID=1870903 RepID=UPI003A9A51E8
MSYTSTMNSQSEAGQRRSCAIRPGWSPLTIGLMVLGFIFAWPIGLAMLAYILWGDRLRGAFDDARHQFRTSPVGRGMSSGLRGDTGNSAFDAYRDRELRRLEEERARIETMRAEFDDFLRELRRKKDHEEFDRFMADRGHAPAPRTGD